VTTERFAQGMTPAQYLDQMGMNKDRLLRAMSSTTIGAHDLQVFERYAGTSKVLVITEDWCGTALGSLPFVFKLAEAAAPSIEARVFLRDANLDLMDQFLKDGLYRSIPVYVFFDGEMNELARFIERRPA